MLILIILLLVILLFLLNQPCSKENFGCGSGKACCKPGYYGDSSENCSVCPANKPSSPFSHPRNDCTCQNNNINSCFACRNKCAPYDPHSRMCTPIKCPDGHYCKVNSKTKMAECIPD